jgi:hypothetical protein
LGLSSAEDRVREMANMAEIGLNRQLVETYEVAEELLKVILEHERQATEEAGDIGLQADDPTVNVSVTNGRMAGRN